MPFFRLVSKQEILLYLSKGLIFKSHHYWTHYTLNEVIFLFKKNSPLDLNTHFSSIINSRRISLNHYLYILEMNIPEGDVTIDKSQSGWSDSVVYKSEINLEHVNVIGKVQVTAFYISPIIIQRQKYLKSQYQLKIILI